MRRLNKKNKILFLGFIAILYLCYSFAISKTVYYYNQNKEKEELIDKTFNNPKVLAKLTLREKQIDKWLADNNTSSSSFQNQLLKKLSQLCNQYNLKIVDFKEPHQFEENQTITTSYIFSLQGGFNGIIHVVNKIENQQNLGKVKNISFIKKQNYKTQQDYLVTTAIIQKTENKKIKADGI